MTKNAMEKTRIAMRSNGPQKQVIVDQPVIDALRMQIPVSREDSMWWVDDLFEVAARNAYNAVGRPPLDNLLSGWEIFSSMVQIINVASSST